MKAGTSTFERNVSLLLSLGCTAALFALLLLISLGRPSPGTKIESLAVFTMDPAVEPINVVSEPEEAIQPETFADAQEEASPTSAPIAISAAPSLPIVPPTAFELSPIEIPEVPVSADGLVVTPGAISKGDRARGRTGQIGAGGNGTSGDGDGTGGSGKGEGRERKLTASWAPDMDFSRNYKFFPMKARAERIEGAAVLRCYVLRNDRVRDCRLIEESPQGY